LAIAALPSREDGPNHSDILYDANLPDEQPEELLLAVGVQGVEPGAHLRREDGDALDQSRLPLQAGQLAFQLCHPMEEPPLLVLERLHPGAHPIVGDQVLAVAIHEPVHLPRYRVQPCPGSAQFQNQAVLGRGTHL
jgi:hypothetical protein